MTTYKTIDDLPAALAAEDSDLVEISQAGISRRVTVAQMVPSIPTTLPPNGPAGGVLSGTYPNPGFLVTPVFPADLAPYALLASPTFTGDPKAPTPATADNDTSIATTAFVKAQGFLVASALDNYLPLTGGTLTGGLAGTTATFTGNIDTTGGSVRIDRAGDAAFAQFYMDADAGQQSRLTLRTGTLDRWVFGKNSVAESGSNAGSDFFITACNDAGAGSTALAISRATLGTTLSGALSGTAASFTGNITSTGGNIVASGGLMHVDRAGDAVGAELYLSSDAGTGANIVLRTGTLIRWVIQKEPTAEGGSNAGSNLYINRYSDAGTSLGTALSINRASAEVTMNGVLSGTSAAMTGNIVSTGGSITASGGEVIVDRTGDATTAEIQLRTDTGRNSRVTWKTGTLDRWILNKTSGAESGSAAGSDFAIIACDDAGGGSTAILITRSTKETAFGGHIKTLSDASFTCGTASSRWTVVYATTGAINTSGAAEKTEISGPLEAEVRAARRLRAIGPKRYRFRDAAASKGEHARWHIGYIAEDVRDALAAEGLDPWSYGMLCADEVDGPTGEKIWRYGLRYDELRSFLALGDNV